MDLLPRGRVPTFTLCPCPTHVRPAFAAQSKHACPIDLTAFHPPTEEIFFDALHDGNGLETSRPAISSIHLRLGTPFPPQPCPQAHIAEVCPPIPPKLHHHFANKKKKAAPHTTHAPISHTKANMANLTTTTNTSTDREVYRYTDTRGDTIIYKFDPSLRHSTEPVRYQPAFPNVQPTPA